MNWDDEPSIILEKREQIENLNIILKKLRKDHYLILRLRFGLGTGYARTLEQVGLILGVSRERVRQKESKIIRILRHPWRTSFLNGELTQWDHQQCFIDIARRINWERFKHYYGINKSPARRVAIQPHLQP